MEREAVVSECGRYRYTLSRWWGSRQGRHLYFVMLNPSTADAETDDPTIRKCIGFAMRAGYTGFTVLNLFAWRATDPRELLKPCGNLAGPQNDSYLASVPADADVCFAWGAYGRRFSKRVAEVRYLLGTTRWLCLKQLADGTPAHPLMLPYSCELSECSE